VLIYFLIVKIRLSSPHVAILLSCIMDKSLASRKPMVVYYYRSENLFWIHYTSMCYKAMFSSSYSSSCYCSFFLVRLPFLHLLGSFNTLVRRATNQPRQLSFSHVVQKSLCKYGVLHLTRKNRSSTFPRSFLFLL